MDENQAADHGKGRVAVWNCGACRIEINDGHKRRYGMVFTAALRSAQDAPSLGIVAEAKEVRYE